jgi:diguanylate cyclase (GGDEF)-like protein
MSHSAPADPSDSFSRLRAAGAQSLGIRIETTLATWSRLQAALAASDGAIPPSEAERVAGTLSSDLRALAQDIHRVVGSGGTFGYPAVSAAAAPLELLFAGMAEAKAVTPNQIDLASLLIDQLRIAWLKGPTDSVTARPRYSEITEPARSTDLAIGVVVDDTSSGEILAIVRLLGYAVMRLTPGEPVPDAGLACAIIDDAADTTLAFCQRIAALCPVLLITQEVSFERRLAASRAGATAVLGRPLDPDELADWLDELAGRMFETPFSILVVDDDVMLGEAYAQALQRSGMQVTVVSQSDLAFSALSAGQHDLVLMDVQMPGIDGIDLARVIRQTRRHLFLPIVFLSAEQDQGRQLVARTLSGDDFIAKPVDLDKLVQMVRLRAERARALRKVMERDSLTGLLNHSRFKDRLVRELDRSRRSKSELSLVLLDLDHFKKVNDTFGHLVGDRVIRALARTLITCLRKSDVIGRYGGEEFAALLLDTSPGDAKDVVEKIRQRFRALPFESDRRPFTVTLSAGIAGSNGRDAAETLINAADRALYTAKREGRDRVTIELQSRAWFTAE